MVPRVSIIERFHCTYMLATDVGPVFILIQVVFFRAVGIVRTRYGCGGVCVCDSGQGMELEVHCTRVVNFIMQNVM